jgi:hypothetical protein
MSASDPKRTCRRNAECLGARVVLDVQAAGSWLLRDDLTAGALQWLGVKDEGEMAAGWGKVFVGELQSLLA